MPLPGPLFSEAFFIAYHKAMEGGAKPVIEAGASKTKAGTFDALIAAYYKSSSFTQLEKSTQSTYRNQIEQFRKEHGTKPVAALKAKHVDAILGGIAAKSTAQAQKLRKRLVKLMALAVKWEYITDNPMLNAERVKHKAKGYETWTDDDIAAFRAHWEDGTPQRLAFEILLYTGLRRSDAVKLGRQHIQGDYIVITTKKSGDMVELNIPIHDDFRKVLDGAEKKHLTFITTAYGAARSEKAFTNWLIEAGREAGLPSHRSPHGVRKAACRTLAEAGCTALEIMSITGHTNIKEIETYCAAVNKKRLAQIAMTKKHGAA
ncbi:tyrosine-type recombinase/integrase [Shinella zoogloeoides]|uniref:tyrosine-type recombinase/integrase n=1 Tax=Shinella zoogloeoides TaxID=352475 RepID=UPI0013C2E687|nr:tyrosine-type recombinase/integrase [Shinella zoogloeoides]